MRRGGRRKARGGEEEEEEKEMMRRRRGRKRGSDRRRANDLKNKVVELEGEEFAADLLPAQIDHGGDEEGKVGENAEGEHEGGQNDLLVEIEDGVELGPVQAEEEGEEDEEEHDVDRHEGVPEDGGEEGAWKDII